MHPDDKSQKRVEKLFSDLDQIARMPVATGENKPVETGSASPVGHEASASSLAAGSSTASNEMDALLVRIRELE